MTGRNMTVATNVWTTLIGTGIEVQQISGATVVVHEDALGQWVLPQNAGTWRTRLAGPTLAPDDENYLRGGAAVQTLLDIGTHTLGMLRSMLTRSEEAMISAHYQRQTERYALAKGTADAIRDYLQDLT